MTRADAVLVLITLLVLGGPIQGRSDVDAAEPWDRAGMEFFEKTVRPILAERCHSCHGPENRKGGLRLDTKPLVFEAGGASGLPIVPGDLEESLLIEAISYDSYLQMPPKSKLPDAEIEALTRWVEMGAPWPDEVETAVASLDDDFNLEERARFWSFQPVQDPEIPLVGDEVWSRNPIDRFILAGLDEAGLTPASEADKQTLIRRATFDLIGLPPTPEEIEAFLKDETPDAYERLIERLLASPQYGERWGRHWLDLVRFAETAGHEFDYDIPTAWRYRDYVVRALNADLPYDRFVVEHIAGDLLPDPRRHPTKGTNESILGTAFYYLNEGTHSPVDIQEELRSRVDNQIDVLSKTFLGLTVACARCHDHKFDAISTADYYALAGYLQSTRHQYAFIDPPERIESKVSELQELRAMLGAEQQHTTEFENVSNDRRPDPSSGIELFEDFQRDDYQGWFVTGHAFGDRPTAPGDVQVIRVEDETTFAPLTPGIAHSGAISDRLRGVLRSPTFTIDRPYLHYLAAGREGRINLVIEGFEKIRAPIYGGLTIGVNHGAELRWLTQDVGMWLGRSAYFELDDGATANFTQTSAEFWSGAGYLAVDEIWFTDQKQPPRTLEPRLAHGPIQAFEKCSPESIAILAQYQEIEAELPDPTLALAATEGTSFDERVHIRGSTKNLGEVVKRRFLEALDGEPVAEPSTTSGRLDLARSIVDPENPLTARVLVNRVWHHHFGRGIVRSTDDFGHMGDQPTHPELLDWLATHFVAEGWSLKRLHKWIMLSSTYRMTSTPRPEASSIDPDNLLVHRQNVRRLEAEAVRDAILAVSGQLDPTLFGPSVPPHLTLFMEGRGRPQESGPLDGDRRRSLYLNVRRNFLSPLMLAFDFPVPASTMGRRNVSNVPAQALTLMNDPFVIEQATHWAERALANPTQSLAATIAVLYQTAFGRPPTLEETERALAFLARHGQALGPSQAWADLCHVLLNSKEFLYIP